MRIDPSNQIQLNKPAQSSGQESGPKSGNSVRMTGGKANQLMSKIVPEEDRVAELEEIFDDKTLKRMGAVECATCASRTYQDGSDDPGVSFKAPTHLSPAQAATAVISHEMEHVTNERANAEEEDREVINQSVQIFHSVCPECGKSYVSGGVTKTTTAGKTQSAYEAQKSGQTEGNLVDFEV